MKEIQIDKNKIDDGDKNGFDAPGNRKIIIKGDKVIVKNL